MRIGQRAWRRVTRPFRIRVLTFERAHIRVRSFPPLFEWTWQESLRERIAKGGDVTVEPGIHYVSESIMVPKDTLISGATISGPTRDGTSLLDLSEDVLP